MIEIDGIGLKAQKAKTAKNGLIKSSKLQKTTETTEKEISIAKMKVTL